MPIDLDQVLGAELAPTTFSYDEDDVILYHLGIGAGFPATDARALRYCYEATLATLPTYAVIPSFPMLGQLLTLPGLDFHLSRLLHGEQELQLHRPMPTKATVTNTGRIAEVWDKGKGALVVVETQTHADGEHIATNRFGAFIRGEGGFGGESGPRSGAPAPDREPDHRISEPTEQRQALLYRLSGDKNPMHVDPAFSAKGGFDVPILHGLCTYGAVFRAVVDGVLDGDATRAGSYFARFASHVLPGDTLEISVWDEGDHLVLSATTAERGAVVLNNCTIALDGS
jgi:acyl dehydratase